MSVCERESPPLASGVGTRHAEVHPLARSVLPSGNFLSGHDALDAHTLQSTPFHPAGHSSVVVDVLSEEEEETGATQCAQFAGCGLSSVNSEVLCLHGGSR